MRDRFVYGILVILKLCARIFYRFDTSWVGDPGKDPWEAIRLVAFLNHTSLYEWLFAAAVPNRFLLRIARHGLVPAADTTMSRPIVGRFFASIAKNVVAVSRKRDGTWRALIERIGPDSLVIILPEGRMMRADGLDKHGRPMTVRGGIADVLEHMGQGRMLIAYSGGLHHVQVPGQLVPRLFRTLRMRFEVIEIDVYRDELRLQAERSTFREAVVTDLEARRNRHCPVEAT